jgi:hypothetical protein
LTWSNSAATVARISCIRPESKEKCPRMLGRGHSSVKRLGLARLFLEVAQLIVLLQK